MTRRCSAGSRDSFPLTTPFFGSRTAGLIPTSEGLSAADDMPRARRRAAVADERPSPTRVGEPSQLVLLDLDAQQRPRFRDRGERQAPGRITGIAREVVSRSMGSATAAEDELAVLAIDAPVPLALQDTARQLRRQWPVLRA